ncbi:enoyl-CoA hydratase/isomerase family protein [Rhodococcus sp. NPDC060176]|uniref:enoyl-CoA hydratase/isomerase family protein n=1 Tax=Rhodococcus sp. NPDC060176 TaxID=3347062 RepID=UPI00364A0987
MSDVTSCTTDSGIGYIRMNRHTALNALSVSQVQLITKAMKQLVEDSGVRVIVISSTVLNAFSVGADLKERLELDSRAMMEARGSSVAMTCALLDVEVPTIAAVHGLALGGGLELALTCDLLIADRTASFGLPETGIGIIPGGGGTQLLPRKIGSGRAKELIMTGRRIDADEAYRYGVVDVLAPGGVSAAGHADAVAITIAAKSATAQRNAKAALRGSQYLTLADGLALEDQLWRVSAVTPDYREGLAAFSQRRPVAWPQP